MTHPITTTTHHTQLRDERGMADDLQERLLGLKRAQLGAVLAGRSSSPPPLATLLFRCGLLPHSSLRLCTRPCCWRRLTGPSCACQHTPSLDQLQ